MKIYLLAFLLLLYASIIYAQDNIIRKCSSSDYYSKQIKKDPSILRNRNIIESKMKTWINNNRDLKSADGVITIPVVFHILYHKSQENVTNAQVYSQLDVLNEDYRRLNYDALITPQFFKGIAADCKIEFCLALSDPNGNSTNGIIRKYTNVLSFSDDDGVKFSTLGGDDIWDNSRYLNIWVCNLGGGIEAGYSSYPGFPPDIDGVVINYIVFGRTGNHNQRYNLGRTCSHEVGHWLSLYHPWGDTGEQCPDSCNCTDYCADTPNQYQANFSCPDFPHYSCSDSSDIFMDYMDYTDDKCMNTFTNDQKLRMIATLNTERFSLQSSGACLPLNALPNIDFTADHTEIPQGRYVNFSATSDKYIKHWLWIFSGAQPDTANYQNPQNIFYYKAGRYTVTLVGTDANGSAKVSKLGYITVDTAGYNKDIKVNYQYYKNDSLKYFINYNSLTINFGKGSFYNVEIKLFSLLGQELISYKQNSILITEDQTITLPLNLSNNVYILSIKTQNGYIHKKLMILH